ncbi:uncharacterized protein LOC117903262 [Drosophila subobscura]|uniref:uncharacterized protein LOC117903262 n=1 Tax=Drosophila subobscura TaxID=7241 RepID=UPI00155B0171|nr:uncharacterized protein LOC117903262 [Drosophila subobscura]
MSKFGYGNFAMLKFLEAYKEQPCLYDPKMDNYKNRMAREKAYAAMIENLNSPNISIKDVKRKIKSIRTVYTKELGIRRCFAEKGRPYETKLQWFRVADTFLRKVSNSHPRNRKKTPTKNLAALFDSNTDISTSEDAIEQDDSFVESIEQISVAPSTLNAFRTQKTSTPNCSARPLSFELTIDNSISVDNSKVEEECSSQSPPIFRPSGAELYRTVQSDSERQDDPSAPAAQEPLAPPPPPSVVSGAIVASHPDDDFTHFALGIASQLRKIPNPAAVAWAKVRMQQVVYSAETGAMESSARNFSRDPNFVSPV